MSGERSRGSVPSDGRTTLGRAGGGRGLDGAHFIGGQGTCPTSWRRWDIRLAPAQPDQPRGLTTSVNNSGKTFDTLPSKYPP